MIGLDDLESLFKPKRSHDRNVLTQVKSILASVQPWGSELPWLKTRKLSWCLSFFKLGGKIIPNSAIPEWQNYRLNKYLWQVFGSKPKAPHPKCWRTGLWNRVYGEEDAPLLTVAGKKAHIQFMSLVLLLLWAEAVPRKMALYSWVLDPSYSWKDFPERWRIQVSLLLQSCSDSWGIED